MMSASLLPKLVLRTGYSNFVLPPLPVAQATAWQLINANGSHPSARISHVAAWSDAATGMYIHGGTASGSVGARDRPVWDERSEATLTSSGSSATRLAQKCSMSRELS